MNLPPDIVRAVAGLLHNMRAIRSEDGNFEADYKRGLSLYQKLCDGDLQTDMGTVSD
jgi:hypothetical protein